MHTNRLAQETSPYLLQHAHNPVDWYPWGEEAFARARQEDKPIFLSIGYSTCHWCHVMERESFENESTAEILNSKFVCIKVDREERPDIDRIYMTYVQATTGSGGWPMSVWLTPELKPFVGGTYFPPDNRYGRPGFSTILLRIIEAWKNDRTQIIESSVKVMEELQRQTSLAEPGPDRIDAKASDKCFQQFRRVFDSRLGGFGAAPKFPRPAVHNFLLRYWKRTGNDEALDMVVTTLLAMEKGGMHDQLGGGFHRYSVDDSWFVPHFEKMLYDQAQLVISYLEAYQITKEPVLAQAARRILDYVLRDMTAPGGAFYSAEDADSVLDPGHPHEKVEGAFYMFSWLEVFNALGSPRSLFAGYRYGMESDGNVSHDPHGEFAGRNILFQAHTIEETAHYFDEPLEAMQKELAEADRQLLELRATKPRPHLDNKILTCWNGMMISAFAKAGAILGEESYVTAAARAAGFIAAEMIVQGKLLRVHGGSIGAMLDDYAWFIQALLDLYETTFEPDWLKLALDLQQQQYEILEDDEVGGFYASAQPDAASLLRIKDDYDGAEPAGNSIALMNLLRLSKLTGDETSARRLIAAFHERITAAPHAVPAMMSAIEFDLAPVREVVVATGASPEIRRKLWENFSPAQILLASDEATVRFRPELAAMNAPGAVYVCQNFTCQQPVTTVAELEPLLK